LQDCDDLDNELLLEDDEDDESVLGTIDETNQSNIPAKNAKNNMLK
jgi:hypothetical protein